VAFSTDLLLNNSQENFRKSHQALNKLTRYKRLLSDIIDGMKHMLPDGVYIVEEGPEDISGIRLVNQLAFDGNYEADVVDRLRENCPSILSLVAKQGDEVLGHILFSPARIVQEAGWTVSGMGLGPLAVHPQHQGKGIGSVLCQVGMQRMEAESYPFVIVLGHPTYYPRFGFVKASTHGIRCAFEGIPDEAFMIRTFDVDTMSGVVGTAYFRQEFDEES
jgi:putative acetyltransferase